MVMKSQTETQRESKTERSAKKDENIDNYNNILELEKNYFDFNEHAVQL